MVATTELYLIMWIGLTLEQGYTELMSPSRLTKSFWVWWDCLTIRRRLLEEDTPLLSESLLLWFHYFTQPSFSLYSATIYLKISFIHSFLNTWNSWQRVSHFRFSEANNEWMSWRCMLGWKLFLNATSIVAFTTSGCTDLMKSIIQFEHCVHFLY